MYACTRRSFLFSAPRIYMKIWGASADRHRICTPPHTEVFIRYPSHLLLLFIYYIYYILPHKYSQLQAWKLCTILYDPNNRLLVPSSPVHVYTHLRIPPPLSFPFPFSLPFNAFGLRRPNPSFIVFRVLMLLFGFHPVT